MTDGRIAVSAKPELYSLCAELACHRLNANKIARVLECHVGYVTGILRDLGLHRSRSERSLSRIVDRLPSDLQARVAAFRNRKVLRKKSGEAA